MVTDLMLVLIGFIFGFAVCGGIIAWIMIAGEEDPVSPLASRVEE